MKGIRKFSGKHFMSTANFIQLKYSFFHANQGKD